MKYEYDENKSLSNKQKHGIDFEEVKEVWNAYCLFDENKKEIVLRRVSYDIDRVSTKMKELGFEDKFFKNLYMGTRIGGKIDRIECSI